MAKIDPRSSACFQALPTLVKESILQSGITFYSEQEIQDFAQRYQESSGNTPIQ